VHFHFTPTHTSWLNQIECCFSILSRQALKEASFVDVKQLREAIDHYICAYNAQAVVEPDFHFPVAPGYREECDPLAKSHWVALPPGGAPSRKRRCR
jgi:hypothetical protein